MAKVAYLVSRIPVWRPRGFSDREIAANAEAAAGVMKARIARGINLFDTPARPLQKAYQKQKTRKGKTSLCDLDFTGATVAAMGAFQIGPGMVGVGVDWRAHPLVFRRALFNQLLEPQIGLSPNDKQQVRILIVQNRREGLAA